MGMKTTNLMSNAGDGVTDMQWNIVFDNKVETSYTQATFYYHVSKMPTSITNYLIVGRSIAMRTVDGNGKVKVVTPETVSSFKMPTYFILDSTPPFMSNQHAQNLWNRSKGRWDNYVNRENIKTSQD